MTLGKCCKDEENNVVNCLVEQCDPPKCVEKNDDDEDDDNNDEDDDDHSNGSDTNEDNDNEDDVINCECNVFSVFVWSFLA